jgi:HPt (histidine-containing phosphotransfer) domain-containing protein
LLAATGVAKGKSTEYTLGARDLVELWGATMEKHIGQRTDSAGSSPGASGRFSSDEASTGSVFNYEESVTRLGGDGALFDDILDIFLEDAPKLLAQASTSLCSGDSETLERAAHTLKGLSANFAAGAAVEAGYAVELLAREHRLQSAALCFPRLEAELQRLEAALREFRSHRPAH